MRKLIVLAIFIPVVLLASFFLSKSSYEEKNEGVDTAIMSEREYREKYGYPVFESDSDPESPAQIPKNLVE